MENVTHVARDRLLGAAVVALSSAVWALGFGRETSIWIGWVALVPFLVLLSRPGVTAKRAFLFGMVHGFVFWLVSTSWIPETIHTFGGIPIALAWFFLALMALYLGLYKALFAIAAQRILQHRSWTALLCLPAAWVAAEWLQGTAVGSLSFPWNLAAYVWVDLPGTLPLAAWIGVWGVSYLVLWSNAGLALAWRDKSLAGGLTVVLAPLLLLAIAARWFGAEPGRDAGAPGGELGSGRPVRLVQPNQSLRWNEAAMLRRQYEQILLQTRSECVGNEPTLLIWPESAAWPFTWDGSWELRRDLGELASRGCAMVLNTPTADDTRTDGDGYFNSAILVEAPPLGEGEGGAAGLGRRALPTGRYHKRFLVPFGEHVPFGDRLPFLGKLARFAGRFSSGRDAGLLDWQGERLGMALCYEVVFPGGVAEQVRSGATLLVNISNDAWYGDSSAPRQLFRAARFRAAENRRTLLRAALTGISGVIDSSGRVRQRLDLGDRGVLRERVRGSAAELSPYTRAPWLVPLISAILTALGLFQSRRNPTP